MHVSLKLLGGGRGGLILKLLTIHDKWTLFLQYSLLINSVGNNTDSLYLVSE